MRKNFTLTLVLFALPVFLAAQNPVLYLTFDHMDDDESEINDVMNGLMGTASGEIVSDGQFGDAYAMNGSDGYIHFEDNVINRGSFTLTTWFRVASFEGEDPAIFQTDGAEEGGAVFIIMYEDGMECFSNTETGEVAIWAEVAPPLGEWMHLAMTVDTESGIIKIYADGEVVGEAEGTYASEADKPLIGPFAIGAHHNDGSFDRNWNGSVDDFRLYDVALTAEEVADSMEEFEGVGIKSTQMNSLRIFPNPASEVFAMEQDMDRITLFRISGEKMLEITDYQASSQIDVSSLAKGMYILKAESPESRSTTKLVIQ